MTTDVELRDKLLKAYREELWRRKQVWPLLEEYLDRDQLEDTRRFFEGCDVQKAELPRKDWYDELSRQRGKSFKWCVVAVVWCHCHPRQRVKYAAQLGKSVRNIIWPTIKLLVEDMPAEMRGKGETPEEKAEKVKEDKQDHKWLFPNGSELMAAGMNGDHEDDLRGTATHIFIKDECGFYTRFHKVEAVSRPQFLTTRGVSVYATTPPERPDHPCRDVREAMKQDGRYSHRTIYDHPRFSAEYIEEFLAKEAKAKGMTLDAFKKTTYYRREFLCMWVTESTRAVIPEWLEPAPPEWPEGKTWGDSLIYTDLPRPVYFDTYDALDVGGTRDPTAWIGAYWDFSRGLLVVERESQPLYRARPPTIAEEVKELRRALWPATERPPFPEARKSLCGTYWLPYGSIGDGSGFGAEKLDDISAYDVHFTHGKKPPLEVRVNALGTLIRQRQLLIHESCKNLIAQLSSGLWADRYTKQDFERTEKWHLDHLAALVDLVSNIDRQRNPVPPGYGIDAHNTINIYQQAPTHVNVTPLDMVAGNISWEEDE